MELRYVTEILPRLNCFDTHCTERYDAALFIINFCGQIVEIEDQVLFHKQ